MPAWSFRRKLLLQLALLPLWLVVLEIGVRLYTAWDAGLAHAEVLELASSMRQQVPDPYEALELRGYDFEALDEKLLLHPFYGWDKRGSLDDLWRDVAHFREGGEAFEVLVLGGSVAARFKREGEPRLAELMRQDERFAGREVCFHNYARGGFKQPQQASELAYLLALGFAPDAVINIDGFNEVFLSLRNAGLGMHPVYPSSSFWAHFAQGGYVDPRALDLQLATWQLQREAQDLAERTLDRGYLRSAVLGTTALARLRRLRAEWTSAQVAYTTYLAARPADVVTRGPPCPADLEELIEIIAASWAESSRSMLGMCAGRGVAYLHVLQPTLGDEGSKPPIGPELKFLDSLGDELAGLRRGYARLREIGTTLRRDGYPFVDATDLFAEMREVRYLDHCHFDHQGNRLLAQRIAAALLAETASPAALGDARRDAER